MMHNRKSAFNRSALFFAIFAVFIFCGVRTAAAVSVVRLENRSDDMLVRVILETDAPVQPKAFTLDNPPRLILDFPDTQSGLAVATGSVGMPMFEGDPDVRDIRLGRPATSTLRVVFDLRRLSVYQVNPLPDRPGVEVLVLREIKEETVSREIVPGVKHTRFVRNTAAGPMIYHTMELRLDDPHIKIDLEMGQGAYSQRERLSQIVSRRGALLGINGGYFDMANGAPIDILIADGRLLSKPDRRRAFIGFGPGNKPNFAIPEMRIAVLIRDTQPLPVDRYNHTGARADEVAVFTTEFGMSTRTDFLRTDIVVRDGRVAEISTGDAPIPEGGFVVSVDTAAYSELLNSIAPGVAAELSIDSTPGIAGIRAGVTAGPMLVRGGVPIHEVEEEFSPTSTIITKRNPRTAACSTTDGRFIFAAVEGRSMMSVGMFIPELADLMASLGCADAINLDGGGSTEIVAGGEILNNLSDGAERPLANAFLIYYSEE